MLHCKTFVPGDMKLNGEVGEPVLVIVPVPETRLQVPTPTLGVLAANVVTELLTQTVCDGPAIAVAGTSST